MKKIFFLLLYIAIVNYSFSQINIHKNITTEDGLIQGQVNVIRQDSSGYIWLGTYGGASRWDGKAFFDLTTLNGLTASQIMDIEIAPDSTIYFAPYGGGIVSYKNGKLDTLNEGNGLLTNWMSEIHVLKSGGILFGGYQGNISLYKGKKLTQWIDPNLLNKKSVWEFYESDDGTIYIGTYPDGVFRIKKGQVTDYSKITKIPKKGVWSFSENKDGSIFICAYDGLYLLRNDKIRQLEYNGNKINSSIFDCTSDKLGNSFFATSDGLLIWNGKNFDLLTTKNGLLFNELWSLFVDNNGTILLGTNGSGFSIYRHGVIENYNTETGLPDNNVWAIAEGSNDEIYVGTNKGVVIFTDKSKKILSKINGLTGNNIRCIYIDSEDTVYIGTKSGLNIIKNGKITHFNKTTGLIDNQVFCIAKTKEGKVYVGTREGVSIISNGEIKNLTIDNGLIGNYVQTILITKDSTIYFGAYGSGLTYYKNDKFKHITKKDGLVDDKIQSLAEGNDGKIYIATYDGGLNILHKNKISKVDVSDGLSSNSLHSIVIDNQNKVYLSTSKAVNVLEFYEEEVKVRIINSDDGLTSEESNREAALIDSKGNIWLGTKNGLTKYNPKLDLPKTNPPKVYLTGLDIFNEPYGIGKLKLLSTLEHDQNYLKFYFIGINLSAPEKTIYQYKLSGVDKEWVTSRNTNVQYTSLDNGNYTFEVKARNEWGYWSEPVKLAFVINPAWWETWWFYSLIFLLIAGMITFIASYRYRYLLAVEKVRTKISTDLHDSIGSGLTEISFLTEAVKTVSQGNTKAMEGLNTISVTSARLIDNMQDIVWLVNPSKDTLKDLFFRLKDSYQELLKHSNINLKINNIKQLEEIRLPLTFRQHVYLIFKEAINNSIKYSKCQNIVVDIKINKRKLNITLTDDGIGFDLNKIKRGNGLNNMQNRAKTINAKLEFISQLNKGSTIIFKGNFSKLKITEV